MYGFLSLLVIFLTLFGRNNGQQCYEERTIYPGENYNLKNQEYPNFYRRGANCRWVLSATWPQRLKIKCEDMIYQSRPIWGCLNGRLDIQDGSKPAQSYCALDQFPYISESSKVHVTLRTRRTSISRGRFNCTVTAVEPDKCECGRRNTPKIRNGKEVFPNEYPFMAAIVRTEGTREVLCGASIINDKQVLTAAHCVHDKKLDSFAVVIGGHNLNKDQKPGERLGEKVLIPGNVNVHWSYNISTATGLDIALVTVDEAIKFSETTSPVCLPVAGPSDKHTNADATVLGWGADSFQGAPLGILNSASLTVLAEKDCASSYNVSTDVYMCARGKDQDACGSDSGGPLTIQAPTTGKVIQIGIVNKGPDCAHSAPSLFVRIGEDVLKWIMEMSPRGLKYCQDQ